MNVRICLCVRNLRGKRLELSTPNVVHIYSVAALTRRSKGQRSRSQGYENGHGRVAALVAAVTAVLGLLAAAGVGLHVIRLLLFLVT